MSNISHLWVRSAPVADTNRVPVSSAAAAGDENYGIDGQGRTRTAAAQRLFNGKFRAGGYANGTASATDYSTLVWSVATAAPWAFAVDSDNIGSLAAGAGVDTASSVVSRDYFRMGANEATLVSFSGVPYTTSGTPSGTASWGLGTASALAIGFVFGAGGTLSLQTVGGAVAQASFNLDTFDGAGASGYTFSATERQHLWIEVDWASSTYTFGASIDRKRVPLHRERLSDEAPAWLDDNAYRVVMLVDGADFTTAIAAATVDVEGSGDRERGQVFSSCRTAALENLGTTERWLYALRVNAQATSRASAAVRRVSTTNLKGSAHVQYRLIRLISPNAADVDLILGAGAEAALNAATPAGYINANSNIEVAESTTGGGVTGALSLAAGVNTYGGYQVVATHFDLNDGVVMDMLDTRLSSDGADNADIFIVAARGIAGNSNNEDVTCAVDWEEFV